MASMANGSEPALPRPRHILVMGVCGCGKSSLGQALAEALGLDFVEGDALHPEANVRLMAAGTPLTDADRAGWLDALAARLAAVPAGQGAVLACSALKRAYRDRLRQAAPALETVYLHGEAALLAQRLHARKGHYMPASLLPSQLATLEPPALDEHALVLDVAPPRAQVLARALAVLQRPGQAGVPTDRPTQPPSAQLSTP